MCFRPQTQICLSEFLVTGSKYPYNNLFPGNGCSIYIQMKCTLYPDQFSQFELACLLWPIVCNMRGHIS